MSDFSDQDVARIAKAVLSQMQAHVISIPHEEASNIAVAAARTAVQEHTVKLFSLLGYDMANSADIKRMRANLDFIEHLRLGSSTVAKAVVTAVATGFVLGMIGLLWLGAKLSIAQHVPSGK